MASDLNYRYPGLRPFRIDDKDVFYGRDTETRELTDLIRAERTVILFSKSGLGKSSLLNARVCPQLVANGFWPILIRFQPQTEKAEDEALFNLVDVVVDRLRAEFDTVYQNLARQITSWKSEVNALTKAAPADQGTTHPETSLSAPPVDDKRTRLLAAIQAGEQQLAKAVLEDTKFVPAQSILFNAQNPHLWEFVKVHLFPNNAIPIFVFDQFEEFFTFSVGSQQLFAQQLAELIHDQPPTRVVNWLLSIPPFQRQPNTMAWSKQPLIKCLLSIRSDRLFEVDSLKAYIPLIFRNRYKLNPLGEDQAREAIDKPAQAEGDFRTPKFKFSEVVREQIIRELGNKDCEIESSQLQIVCNHFENYVFENYAEQALTSDEPICIDRIDNANAIKRILIKFYRNQLRSIGTPEEIELARKVLENELVINHQRVGLAEFKMKDLLKGHTDIIEKLEKARLIRAEETHLGQTYELSHDTLIEPVENVRQLFEQIRQREGREKERIREREIQLEQQKQAEIERQQFLTERREKDRQLAEEQQQRKQLKKLSSWLIVAGSIAFISSSFAIYYLINNNTLLAKANNSWASDEYEAGNQRMAYRLWESSDHVMPVQHWKFSRSLIDSTSKRLMAPFAGISTQVDPSDTSLRYVANLYQGDYFELWEKTDNGTTYLKTDWLEDSLQLKLATQLQLRNDNLAVFTSDSTLRVVDVSQRKQVFPDTGDYHFPSLNKLWSKGLVLKSRNGAVRPIRRLLLTPKGNWLAVLDTSGNNHLYNLKKKGTEYKSFQQVTQAIPGFNLDSVVFSASEDFVLVKHPGANQYELLDLRSEKAPKGTLNTVYAGFSTSGKYIATLNATGQLVLRNVLATKPLCSVSLPDHHRQIAELIFNRDESIVTIVTKSASANQLSIVYTLFAVNLTQPDSALTVIARDVHTYYPFGWAGHVLFTTGSPASTYNYNVATAQKQRLPVPQFVPINVGKTMLLYKPSSPGVSDKMAYVYDVLSGKQAAMPQLSFGKGQQFVFYASPKGPDEKLIQAIADKLTFFDLKHVGSSGICVYPDQCTKTVAFMPNTLTVSGPLLKIKNQDGVMLSFFADIRKNRLPYLRDHIYPVLTPKDLSAAGL